MRIPAVLIISSLAWLALGAASTCHDGCHPGATRCHGTAVEECASDHDWYTVEDCAAVTPGVWECVEESVLYNGEWLAGCEWAEDGGAI